jgi:hypothetical protein
MNDVRNRGVLFASRSALRRTGSALLDLASPRPLYAAHVGVGGLAGSFSPFGAVEVTPLPISSAYRLDPTSITYPGPATQLNVVNVPLSYVPPTCTPLAGTWSSSSTTVATVSSTGVLTPVSLGNTDVTVECTGLGVRVQTNILVTSPIL